ncbi:MAG TPA: phosphopentomutase [Armatimonadota bacterium]|nr:phosphopentomutase [Armatimonadota bacterium]
MAEAIKRAIIIVLDSVGVGELPDAADYGDAGSNTLGNTANAVGGLNLLNLGGLGLGNIIPILGVPPDDRPRACFGKMAEKSAGKDSTTGHWELAGLVTNEPFPVYPNGFPPEVIEPFEKAIGRGILANKPASGTEIIKQMGEEHVLTGKPIVYTSADSVFQIAAHEEIVPIEQLYDWCEIARIILTGKHAVARVIARPFTGKPGSFERTPRRKDFSLPPTAPTLLDAVSEAGKEVIAIGKIEDIFAGRGITRAIHPAGNVEVAEETILAVENRTGTLIMANLVDFDMKYGHRNDPWGYAAALDTFDQQVPRLLDALQPGDMLIITADHGCDPTTESTDHSREYVPLLVTGPGLRTGVNLGTRASFSDVAATVVEALGLKAITCGTSFLNQIIF